MLAAMAARATRAGTVRPRSVMERPGDRGGSCSSGRREFDPRAGLTDGPLAIEPNRPILVLAGEARRGPADFIGQSK